MYNYEHEISCPQNSFMEKFLWNDYFHDSIITNIAYNRKEYSYDLAISLQCEREWENNREIPLEDEKYSYTLEFIDVRYHCIQCEGEYPEIVNGRFKDTVLLYGCKHPEDKELYHYRIQLNWGYIDIVFRDFRITKAVGDVDGTISEDEPDTDTINERYSIPNIHDRINKGEYSDFMGDINLYLDMKMLYEQNDDELEVYLRKAIEIAHDFEEDLEDARAYIAYLLGKLGNREDLAYIFDLYSNTTNTLIKRNALDAVEALKNAE